MNRKVGGVLHHNEADRHYPQKHVDSDRDSTAVCWVRVALHRRAHQAP